MSRAAVISLRQAGELPAGFHRGQIRLAQQGRESLGPAQPGDSRRVAVGELALDLGQPVPAMTGQLDPQVRFLLA